MRTTQGGWYQVVIPPDDPRRDALLAAANEAADNDPEPIAWSPWLSIKLHVGKWLHPYLHHYVPMRQWDQGSQRIIATGWLVCMWCPKAKEA